MDAVSHKVVSEQREICEGFVIPDMYPIPLLTPCAAYCGRFMIMRILSDLIRCYCTYRHGVIYNTNERGASKQKEIGSSIPSPEIMDANGDIIQRVVRPVRA